MQEDTIPPFTTCLICGSKSFAIEHFNNLRQQPSEPPVRKSHSIAFFEFIVNTFEVLKPTGKLLSSLSVLSQNCSTCSQNFY